MVTKAKTITKRIGKLMRKGETNKGKKYAKRVGSLIYKRQLKGGNQINAKNQSRWIYEKET